MKINVYPPIKQHIHTSQYNRNCNNTTNKRNVKNKYVVLGSKLKERLRPDGKFLCTYLVLTFQNYRMKLLLCKYARRSN
jgi:hypothetical protein